MIIEWAVLLAISGNYGGLLVGAANFHGISAISANYHEYILKVFHRPNEQ